MDSTQLLIIDPQNDFCDIPGAALPVTGADADMHRLAAFIDRAGDRIGQIHVTLDSHHPIDIAHPGWWRAADGSPPAAFTQIAAADLRQGRWHARDPQRQASSLAYVEALEASGRHRLIVWPEHCLIGGWGHNVHSAVKAALDGWARRQQRHVDYVAKGSNPTTEHYSAIMAEVPDPADPQTGANSRLIDALATADAVVVAGEALSHCVASTVRDLIRVLPTAAAGKLTLLADCCSPVGGFAAAADDFVAEAAAAGVIIARSTEVMT